MKTFALMVVLLSGAALAQEAATAASPASHPEGVEKMPMGIIQGGWGYVYAAYGAGLLGLLIYGGSLMMRRSNEHGPKEPHEI